MTNPYESIEFDPDGVAWIGGTKITVEQVLNAMSSLPAHVSPHVRKVHATRTLGITTEQLDAAETFARDSWCSPQHVADVLPERHRLFDPCSNPRSLVDAVLRWSLETGQNALEKSWEEAKGLLAYINAGFSDLGQWMPVLKRERSWLDGVALMCNVDNSTQWWRASTELCACVFLFDKRLPFIPHPGVSKSTNNKPQALIGDRTFFDECRPGLFELGEMYEKARARTTRAA